MSRRLLLPILLTVLFGIAATATAHAAGGGGSGGAQWPGTSMCAEGTLAFADADATSVGLTGSVRPCAGTDPATVAGARWAVATYRDAGGSVYEFQIHPFDSATAPTMFSARVTVSGLDGSVGGPARAACLITAPRIRLACVEITAEPYGGLIVAPIPVSDPRVTFVETVVRDPDGDPECGACV